MRSISLGSTLILLASLFVACGEDEPVKMTSPTGPYMPPTYTGGVDDPAGMEPPPGGELMGNTEPPPAGGNVPMGGGEVGIPELEVCNDYEFRGQTYNCSEFDKCAEGAGADPAAFACAECYSENGLAAYANQPCPEICDDEQDNDGDGYADCEDRACIGDPNCPAPEGGGESPVLEVEPEPQPVESCMRCHNGSEENDYQGSGITNPHPFGTAARIRCTQCHGGNPEGNIKDEAHVPAPPAIGDRLYQQNNLQAAFNRQSLAGIDKLTPETYPGNGEGGCENDQCTNIDYLQFVNPGDLRVVSQNRGCGSCHGGEHGDWVPASSIGTTNGFFSGTRFLIGVENRIPEYRTGFDNEGNAVSGTSARAVDNPAYDPNNRKVGEVGRLVEQPEIAQYNNNGVNGPMYNNAGYNAAALVNDIDNTDINRPNRVRTGSNLEQLIDEQVSITCGNCHLYSAGDNNRYGDFRSSGCTACHMQYSLDGRSRSADRYVRKDEPADPDQIAPGERAHVADHTIRNVSKFVNGVIVRGITDVACVGCHQGSNRTVMQYWGIRLDQNQDLENDLQYPANPDNFTNTAEDRRLFDPVINNNTFNGRVPEQYILFEDYDNDGLDDTPPDVHYENGMGCIDCHGSRDLHGGTANDVSSGKIMSRQDQSTAITCESCHGDISGYAPTAECEDYTGQAQECVVDRMGNPLRHVTKNSLGEFWLISRVYGDRHYVPQTYDLVTNNQKRHPETQAVLFSPNAAYSMGRIGADQGSGPVQADPNMYSNGFSHTDNLDCTSCHASWTNNCIGCHLANAYNANPNEYFFSNITGERILLQEDEATFVYQSPLFTYLGINSKGYVTQIDPAEKMFYRYKDINGDYSDTFEFSDRLGEGNNPDRAGRNTFPALAMNQMSPHSIRGRIDLTSNNEGLRYCVTCHLTQNSIDNQGADYQAFKDEYYNIDNAADFENLLNNFGATLVADIGQNTSNQNDSPFFVHMTAGLGSALLLFDDNGCPINPFDQRADRADPNQTNKCDNQSPQDNFNDGDSANIKYDLDRIVEFDGQTNSSSIHPRIDGPGGIARNSSNYMMSGPLNRQLLEKLSDPELGVVLDSWLDANGQEQGNIANYLYAQ